MTHAQTPSGMTLMAVGVAGNVATWLLSAVHAIGGLAQECSAIVSVVCMMAGLYFAWRKHLRDERRDRVAQSRPR